MTELNHELASRLQARFGTQFSQTLAVREQHGRDESAFAVPPPDAVVFAESTQDVQDAVRLCAAHGTPVIPFGSGSSLEGHLLAVQGGVTKMRNAFLSFWLICSHKNFILSELLVNILFRYKASTNCTIARYVI